MLRVLNGPSRAKEVVLDPNIEVQLSILRQKHSVLRSSGQDPGALLSRYRPLQLRLQ